MSFAVQPDWKKAGQSVGPSMWYEQAHVRLAMFATVRVPAPFLEGGGGQKVFSFLFRNKKNHHLK